LDNESKFHLVNWKKDCTSLHLRGLEIRSLVTFNQALLGVYGGLLWTKRLFGVNCEVVDKKYDSLAGGWCMNVVVGPYEVSLWKYIWRGWDAFSSFVTVGVGDGS
jgi:hypothetical protein